MKPETKFSRRFRHWIMANSPRETTHYELKETGGEDYFNFKDYEEHQIVYGMALRDSPKGVLMRNMSGNGEPDYTYAYRDPVCVVIKYPEMFCIIPLAKFMFEATTSKRKSLTSTRAAEIALTTVKL